MFIMSIKNKTTPFFPFSTNLNTRIILRNRSHYSVYFALKVFTSCVRTAVMGSALN